MCQPMNKRMDIRTFVTSMKSCHVSKLLLKFEENVVFSSEAVASVQSALGLKRINTHGTRQRKHVDKTQVSNNDTSGREKDCSPADVKKRKRLQHTRSHISGDHNIPEYRVQNYFWYYLFQFGAFAGAYPFYHLFFPFWFYNINSWVIRRVILLWGITMYVGQTSKEILKWPRPRSPPVVPLEPRYFKEYGMPSTHAMVGTLIPFSILFLTMDKVQYSVSIGVIAATAWTLLVCFSRLYKGMHYILDVVVGVVLTFALMGIIFPFLDRIDEFLMTDKQAPFLLAGIITFLSLTYPSQQGLSSSREDTIVILSVTGTIYTSLWLNNYFQWHPGRYDCDLPDTIKWPTLAQLGVMICREVIGVLVTVLAHIILKPIVLEVLSFLYSIEINSETRKWLSVEFPYKYVTYTLVGLACLLGSPVVFTLFGI